MFFKMLEEVSIKARDSHAVVSDIGKLVYCASGSHGS